MKKYCKNCKHCRLPESECRKVISYTDYDDYIYGKFRTPNYWDTHENVNFDCKYFEFTILQKIKNLLGIKNG